MSGYTPVGAELLYSLPAAVTKNTYTTQACMSAPAATAEVAAVPSRYFSQVGRALYLRALGTAATTSAATLAVALGLDTTAGTIANSATVMAATAPVAAITAEFTLEAWYTGRVLGETGGLTVQVDGRWTMDGSASSGGAAVATALCAGFSASLTPAGGANQQFFIELFGTWSASAAGNTTTLNQMFLWGLN